MLRFACSFQGRRVSDRRAFGIGVLVLCVALQAVAAAARLQDEDPFADELNPFGTGRKPAPTVPAEQPAVERLPGREADRPLDDPAVLPAEPPADRPAAPRDQPRQRPRLPVPFPDSDLPGNRFDRRGGPVPRGDRQASPPADRGNGLDGDQDPFAPPPPRPPSPAEKKLLEADQLEKRGDLTGARDRLQEVIKLDPTLALGHLALGVVLRRLGDFRGSVDACSKGIAVDPEEPELFLRRGIAWFHLGLYGIALEDFEEAGGMAYDDPRPEMWRGLTLMELDRPLEAINAYAAAIRRDRTFMLAYLNRGLAYLATNEPRKAEFDFNQAIRQAPGDARPWAHRGVAQARQARYREAIESYETALKIAPKDAATRRNLEAAKRLLER